MPNTAYIRTTALHPKILNRRLGVKSRPEINTGPTLLRIVDVILEKSRMYRAVPNHQKTSSRRDSNSQRFLGLRLIWGLLDTKSAPVIQNITMCHAYVAKAVGQ